MLRVPGHASGYLLWGKARHRHSFHELTTVGNHLPGAVVLRTVARADKLVLCFAPRHDTSQVSAHGDDPVVLDLLVFSHCQVSSITLEAGVMKAGTGAGAGEGAGLRSGMICWGYVMG